MAQVSVKAYASPGAVLLAFDWPEGQNHPDFLGFAISRDPGYGKDGKPQFLFNKLDFKPLTASSKPKGSDQAPIQKFNWWDGGIEPSDRGRQFTYTVTPVLGTDPQHLTLVTAAARKLSLTVPQVIEGGIGTWFNRAVVSSQSFIRLKNTGASLEKQMDWLANGLQEAVPGLLSDSDGFDCAIYHLTDRRWILPAFAAFQGPGTLIYFDKASDHASDGGVKAIPPGPKVTLRKRTKISSLMHDKFVVSRKGTQPRAVLMGSTNFTPEAQTSQANLLHVIQSPQLANLYAARASLLAGDPSTTVTAHGAGWTAVTDVAGTAIRVFFLPEPGKSRVFLDTATTAVQGATSSVLFCMFTASDKPLMDAIFAIGDRPDRLIYGLLNSISDPDKPTKSGKKPKLPPIAVTIYNRSRKNPDTLKYDRFLRTSAPRGFLPELAAINTSKYSGGKGPPVAIHIHHKFIVIDGETDHPTLYSGSPNFSKASENSNDENVLELKGNQALASVYVAEFLRLYNHYRARAIWNRLHEGKSRTGSGAATHEDLVLATNRDGWARLDFQPGTKEFLARTHFL